MKPKVKHLLPCDTAVLLDITPDYTISGTIEYLKEGLKSLLGSDLMASLGSNDLPPLEKGQGWYVYDELTLLLMPPWKDEHALHLWTNRNACATFDWASRASVRHDSRGE